MDRRLKNNVGLMALGLTGLVFSFQGCAATGHGNVPRHSTHRVEPAHAPRSEPRAHVPVSSLRTAANGLHPRDSSDPEAYIRLAEGTVETTFFSGAVAAGMPPRLALEAADIFQRRIDFSRDICRGDSFVILFEENHRSKTCVGCGRILAALLINRGRKLWAFNYTSPDGRSAFYDPDGRPLQPSFLETPVDYTRVSSRYSRNRLHPILNVYRPHLGVDFAAPHGTPIRAIGHGRVVFAGWKGGYGRYIMIRHNDRYTSTYGHLFRFAEGIAPGKQVAKAAVIGFVGSTGLATGPHLDFRLLKDGRYVNPLEVDLPDAAGVTPRNWAAFRKYVREFRRKIENVRFASTKPRPPQPRETG